MLSAEALPPCSRCSEYFRLIFHFRSCRWVVEGPGSEAFKQHVEHVRDFMWMSKDGMMACGEIKPFNTLFRLACLTNSSPSI